MRHLIQIRWDPDFDGLSPDIQSYHFETKAKLTAFMEGVAAARDTGTHQVIYDSREASPAPTDVQIVCRTCGGDAVLRDAYVNWDPVEQKWVLMHAYDDAICEGRCEGRITKLDEVNLIEWLKNQKKEQP